jgi:hypothetical protein
MEWCGFKDRIHAGELLLLLSYVCHRRQWEYKKTHETNSSFFPPYFTSENIHSYEDITVENHLGIT